jgi:hypothetical protein
MTTNHTSFTQPLGITFGTSNCSASGFVMEQRAVENYVAANQDELTKEIAQGSGERLKTLALLNGCTTEDSQDAFAQMAQASFEKLFPEAQFSAESFVSQLQSEAMTHEDVSQLCRVATR